MCLVGNNVFSLRGFRITEVPEYMDRRGGKVSFAPVFCSAVDQSEIVGTRTVLGLVIHPHLVAPGQALGWIKWSISDPKSGLAAAHGNTRQGALDDLALKVAYVGGEAAFISMLDGLVGRSSFGFR